MTMKNVLKRRQLVASALAAAACVLPASSAFAQAKPFDGVTLRVGTYGGLWQEAVHNHVGKKIEAMGAKVEYVIGNPADNFSKIVSARGRQVPVDVMEIGPAERIAMTKNGFLEELPVDKIPNLSKVNVKVLDKTAIAHQIVQLGILVRNDKFAADKLPIPKTFKDLEDPRLANRIAFPDVTNAQHWPIVAALSSLNGGNESTPEKGFQEVMKMKPLYYYNAATELAQKITMGDVIAAPWHAGMAVRMDAQGVTFIHPQIGSKKGAVEYNYLAIVKGTKNVDAAAAFINIWLDPQTQAAFSKPVGVIPVSPEARAILSKDATLAKHMMLDEKDLANSYSMDWSKVDVEKWRTTWARTVSK